MPSFIRYQLPAPRKPLFNFHLYLMTTIEITFRPSTQLRLWAHRNYVSDASLPMTTQRHKPTIAIHE